MSDDPQQQEIEPFKVATSSTLRAIARESDLEITYSAAEPPIGKVGISENPRLPLPDYDMGANSMRLVRGCADAHALRIAHHDQNLHLRLRPSERQAALSFDALEQARCEALGAVQMDGVAGNLNAVLAEKCARLGFEHLAKREDANMADALHILTRLALTGEAPPPSGAAMIDLWQPWIDEHCTGKALGELKNTMNDQQAFAKTAHNILKSLELNLGDLGEDIDTLDHDGDSQSGEETQEDESSGEQEEDSAGAQGMDEEDAEGDEFDQTQGGDADEFSDDMDMDGASEMGADAPPQRVTGQGAESGIGYYKIYTDKFDEEIDASELAEPAELTRLRSMLDKQLFTHQAIITKLANQLQRKLMAKQQRSWQFDMEEGILDASRLARMIANPTVPLSFKQEKEMPFRDTVVSILIDNSGSMRGRPIALAAMAADIVSRTLERCGLKVEILGFTTRTWKGGQSRELWQKNGSPEKPGRLNDLRHIIYKSADAPMRRTRKNIALMLKEGILKENIDGEALVWAYNRLARRPEARKIIMVISDGAPVDDSTLSVNQANILEDDLRSIIKWLEDKSQVELTAIGIGHDVTKYYDKAITIADADGLAGALISQLADLFDEG